LHCLFAKPQVHISWMKMRIRLFLSACVALLDSVRVKLLKQPIDCHVGSEVEAPSGMYEGDPMVDATVVERVGNMIIVDWPGGERHYRVHAAEKVKNGNGQMCGNDIQSQEGNYFVFMDRYKIVNGVAYHTHILLCNEAEFDKKTREHFIAWSKVSHASSSYTRVERHQLAKSNAMCWVMQFGMGDSDDSCSGVRYRRTLLREWDPAITGASDQHEKDTYIFGMFIGSPDAFHDNFCDECGGTWKANKYDLIRRNCNSLSLTLLKCRLGMRGNVTLPYLGLSRMNSITCPCASRH